jgi:hypothetical protein
MFGCYDLLMSAKPAPQVDSPEVAVFRKKARGEPLTEAEQAILARTYRKPEGAAREPVSQAQIEAMLAERKLRGE